MLVPLISNGRHRPFSAVAPFVDRIRSNNRLTIVPVSLTSGVDATDSATQVTSSINPTAGRVLVAFVKTVRAAGSIVTPTCSGNGLTWTEAGTVARVGVMRLTAFVAPVVNPVVGALTFDCGGQVQDSFNWSVIELSGAASTATVIQTADVVNNVGTTSAATELATFENTRNINLTAVGLSGNFGIEPTEGFSELADVGAGSGPGRLQTMWALNDATCTATFPSTTNIALALEVRSATGPRRVPTDGPDGWYVPQSAADFAALGLPAPDFLWLCQEPSGDLTNTLGTSLPLTANATGHLYEQSVTGWTRKFLGTDGATAGQSWRTSSALLDLATGESAAIIALASHSMAVTSTRSLMALSSTGAAVLFAGLTTGVLRSQHGTNIADGTIDHSGLDTVHQLCWFRRGDINQSGTVTELESITGTHEEVARTGTIRGIGTVTAHAVAEARYCWLAIYKGANAERDWSAYLATLRGE